MEELEKLEKDVADCHPYKIWHDKKDQRWYTRIIVNGKRKQVSRKDRKMLLEYLYDFYHKNINILKKYKEDFSLYKEINVWDVLPGAYLISPNGDIYSTLIKQWLTPQIDDVTKTYKGQYYIILQDKNHEPKRYSIARLTLAMFKGLPPQNMKNPSVDHIDGDSLNNYYENLRWMEHYVNSSIRRNRGIGEMNSRAILTQEDVMHICNMFVRGNCSISNIAKQYNVSDSAIRSIYERKNWDYVTSWYEFSPNIY